MQQDAFAAEEPDAYSYFIIDGQRIPAEFGRKTKSDNCESVWMRKNSVFFVQNVEKK